MNLNSLNLNRLRCFHAVYQSRGIRNAAKVLHVTPAAASVALKSLEDELDLQLFTRVGNEMVPTRSAVTLFGTVERFFVDLDNTLVGLEGDSSEMRGTVRIGAPNGFGTQILVPLVRSFQRSHPAVDVVFRFGAPDRLEPLLLDDQIDMAVIPRSRKGIGPQIKATKLSFEYEPRLVCSRHLHDSRLANKRRFEAVTALDHVSLWGGKDRIRSWYRQHFGKRPEIRFAVEVDNIFAAVATVRDGGCVALLPSDVVAADLQSGELVVVFPKLKEKKSPYYLLQLKNRHARLAESTLHGVLTSA